MLTNPILEKFRNGDFIQYLNNLLQIVPEAQADQLKLAPQRAAIADTMQKLNDGWHPNKGNEYTAELAKLDAERDSLFTGLKITVDTWAVHHYHGAVKQAAVEMKTVIGRHGSRVVALRYQQETATINAIIHELETETAEDLKRTGLINWVNKLKAVNDEFNEVYIKRTQNMSQEQEGFVAELRKKGTEEYRLFKMVFDSRINLAIVDSGADLPAFQKVEADLNALTEQYNDAVKRFKNSNNSSEDDKKVFNF